MQTQAAPEAERIAEPTPAPSAVGRLYKSAGCEEPVEAVVALPTRRHTMAHPVAQARAASSSLTPPSAHAAPAHGTASAAPQSPITINSRIPRQIEDPAIAEVLAAPVPRVSEPAPVERPAHEGFTSWFRAVRSAAPAADPHAWAEPDAAPRTGSAPRPSIPARLPAQPRPSASLDAAEPARDEARDTGGPFSLIGFPSLSLPTLVSGSRSFALMLFAVTTIIGILDNRISGGFGTLTGVAFVLATAAGAWMLPGHHRWAGRVLPAYVLMASILVAGQFSSVAPGRSIIGQGLLIATGLISLAPWLAAATVIAMVLPRRRV